MAGVDLGGGGSKSHGKGAKKHKSKKRINIRIDMTPMVDVIMLLLTFFMLTTVFSTPQTMEINVPPENETKVEVGFEKLLTLRITPDGTIYYNKGIDMPKALAFQDLHKFLAQTLAAEPGLVCLLKVNREAKYEMMVDIMDEINIAGITRFSLAPFNEADERVVQKAKGSA
jgi:biopolymer transport protein ExbD